MAGPNPSALLVVPFLAQWLADRYGRRPLITVAALFTVRAVWHQNDSSLTRQIGGPLISGLGKTRGTFIGGRVLTGVGNSFVQVTAPTLIAEIAHPRFRPVVTASYQPTAFVGAVVCGWIMFGVTKWNSDWAWRVPTILQCASFVPVLFWSLSPWMVESPRFLVYSGQQDKAHALLAKLHANGDLADELVVNELNEIVEACEADRNRGKTSSFADFVRTPGNIKRLLIILLFGFISQMSGVSGSWLGKGGELTPTPPEWHGDHLHRPHAHHRGDPRPTHAPGDYLRTRHVAPDLGARYGAVRRAPRATKHPALGTGWHGHLVVARDGLQRECGTAASLTHRHLSKLARTTG